MEENQEYILLQLEKHSRKQARYAKIQCIFSVIAALFCGGLLLVVVSLLPKVNEVVDQAVTVAAQAQNLASQAEGVMINLDTVTRELAEADLAGMVQNVDVLVTSSQDGLSQALEKINEMDIEALNKAIGNLSAVVDPMAKFFKVFQ